MVHDVELGALSFSAKNPLQKKFLSPATYLGNYCSIPGALDKAENVVQQQGS